MVELMAANHFWYFSEEIILSFFFFFSFYKVCLWEGGNEEACEFSPSSPVVVAVKPMH